MMEPRCEYQGRLEQDKVSYLHSRANAGPPFVRVACHAILDHSLIVQAQGQYECAKECSEAEESVSPCDGRA